MNNSYSSNASLHQQQPQHQHQHQNAQQQQPVQSIAYLPAHAHIQAQAHRHLNATNDDHLSNTGTTTFYDARTLEKTYANYANATGRYFTTPHNTILITNNFAQQNLQNANAAANNFNNNNNIRILSAAANANMFNLTKDATNDAAATLQLTHGHLFHTQPTSHQHFTTHTCQPHFAALATPQQQQQQQPHATMHFANLPVATTNAQTPTQYFVHATDATLPHVESGNKMLPTLVAGTPSTLGIASMTNTKTTAAANDSTVVLDRINICINNHYNEALNAASATTSEQKEQQPQQPSPVIPAIQHKTTLLPDNVATLLNAARIANMESNQAVHVVDEPDSTTTTSQTPPTTPNTIMMEPIPNSPTHQSPSTTTTTTTATIPINELQLLTNNINSNNITATTMQNLNKQKTSYKDIASKTTITATTTIVIDCEEEDDDDDDDDVEEEEIENDSVDVENERENQLEETVTEKNVAAIDEEDDDEDEENDIEEEASEEVKQVSTNLHNFKIGEDVLLKRQDNRFYLGTVIGNVSQQYLVRFDDKSEQWCAADEMRKLGGIVENSTNSTLNNHNKNGEKLITETCTQMCVVCKRQQPNDVVECCERCGRGYHRGCTSEVSPGSGEWFCKR